jgi:hypothetical protein
MNSHTLSVAATPELYAQTEHVASPADGHFYHTMDVPGHGLQQGFFDLRAGVSDYLGGVSVRGRRVLEMGTADGFLCFHMERAGAEVVAFDLAKDAPWDVVPFADASKQEYAQHLARHNDLRRRLNAAFWFCHRAFRSRARLVHGSVYTVPPAIGPVDITTFGAILLHVRDPFLALQQALRLTRETVIITEPFLKENFPPDFLAQFPLPPQTPAADADFHHFQQARGPFMVFLPNPAVGAPWDTWWYLSPDLLRQFIGVLGFGRTTINYHRQAFAGGRTVPFYTLVGHRTA